MQHPVEVEAHESTYLFSLLYMYLKVKICELSKITAILVFHGWILWLKAGY
jgi:hypothetical protein